MDKQTSRNWKIFGIVVTLTTLATGGFILYEYIRIKRLNAIVMTPSEAKKLLAQGLNG